MRQLMVTISTCAVLAASAMTYAATAEKMDESTNANSNVDVKTQNLQQKPNSDEPKTTDKKSHKSMSTSHEHKSNVDQASDEMAPTGKSTTEKLRQAPN